MSGLWLGVIDLNNEKYLKKKLCPIFKDEMGILSEGLDKVNEE